MTSLRMSVLGGFELYSHAGTPIQLPPKKARALLAYLALTEPRPQPRDKLAALLWEDSSDSQARTSLRQALSAIRRSLEAAEALLDADAETVWLKRDGLLIDAEQFQQCAAASSVERLREAVELYRGSLLDGFDIRAPAFEDWLRAERERLRNLAVGALSALVEHQMRAANHGEALLQASRLLALDPLREEAHRAVMRIYAAQGRHAQAIEQYRRCREALRLDLGVNPGPETERLYRDILEQRRAPVSPAREEVPLPSAAEAAPAAQNDSRPRLRHAQVLLVDIDGFTTLAGETDPEDLHEFLTRYRQMVRARVQEEGGTVTNYIQARVMAVFGVPVAYGNDAERAVRAALAVRDEVPRLPNPSSAPLEVRLGVASGAVLASRDESGLTITGEPVSVAARIMESAYAGELRLAADVRETLGERLIAEPVTDAAVLALRKPLQLWRALGLDAGAAGRGIFVGRQAELRQLEDLLAACAASRTGRAVLIRGEPGIGKSRLVEELGRRASQSGFGTHVVVNLEFGSTPNRPIVQVARSLLGIPPRADAETLSFALRRAGEDRIVAPDLWQCLAELLDAVPVGGARRAGETGESMARVRGRHNVLSTLVAVASKAKPLLVAVEDVHWADPITLDYLATIASAARSAPVALIMTARAESDPIGSAWRAASGGCPLTTIDLGPLTETEAMELAAQLAPDPEFARNCVARASGHPLFLDQLLRAGSASGALPGSLQSLVLARLDRLALRDRDALQAAAVLGQRFPVEALFHLLGDEGYAPDRLVEQGLLRPDAGDYVFVHSLIQEAVYGSILKSHRFDLHLKAGRWFAKRDPILEAQHLDAAGHPGAPAAYLRAARELAAGYRTRQALDLISRGLGLAPQESERCDLLLARADCLRDLGETERSVQACGEALHAAQNDAQRCRAWIGIAAGLRILDRYDRALAALDHALPLAQALGDTHALMQIHSLRGNIHFPRGDIANCLAAHEEARRLALEIGAPAEEARALSGLGDAYYQSARVRTARDYYGRCVKLARAHGLTRIEATNLPMVAITGFYCGETDAAVELCREALAQSTRIGDFRAELLAYNVLASVHYYRGEHAAALASAERALELSQRLGTRRFEARALMMIALARHAAGDARTDETLLDSAWSIVQETGPHFSGPWILGAMTLVLRDEARRRQALADGEALLAKGCVSHNHFHFYQYAIDFALQTAQWDEAERLAAALENYTAAEPLTWTDLIAARGRVLARVGRGERSASLKQEAQALAASLREMALEPAARALERALAD